MNNVDITAEMKKVKVL